MKSSVLQAGFAPRTDNVNNFKTLGQLKDFLPDFASIRLNKTQSGIVLTKADGTGVNLQFSKSLNTALKNGSLSMRHLPLLEITESTITPTTGEMAGKEVIINRLAIPKGFNQAGNISIADFLTSAANELPATPKGNFSSMDMRALGISH